MPFYRKKGTTRGLGTKSRGDGDVEVYPARQFPPGYIDPIAIQQRQRYYLKKWEAEGKPVTQFRRALALAVARKWYYAPTIEQNRRSRRWQMSAKFHREHPDFIHQTAKKALAARRRAQQAQARGEAVVRHVTLPTE